MIDYSTLNADALRKLPTYRLPPTYQLGSHGSACYDDPPGFPSYFLQPIYTQHGNGPPYKRPQQVIVLDKVLYVIPDMDWSGGTATGWEKREAFLRTLYVAPPYDNPRVQLWIRSQFGHLQHCYYDPVEHGYLRNHTLIYPVPDYELRHTQIDDRWRPEVIAAYEEADRLANEAIIVRATGLATTDNSLAHRAVTHFYPEHTVEMSGTLLTETPSDPQADWWHLEAEQPSVEECLTGGAWLHYKWRHPRHPRQPGQRCLRCGRTNEAPEEAPCPPTE